MKRIIGIILLLAVLFSLSGCRKSIFPRGYTGGLGIPFGSGREIFWVDSYDEMYNSANLLKEHNSSFRGGYIFDENDVIFFTKYCFIFDYDKDEIDFKDSPYDRWAELVEIRAYGFFEDVSLDELVYSDISDYDYITVSFTDLYYEKYANSFIDPIMFECRWDDESSRYYGSYNEDRIFYIDYNSHSHSIPSDNTILTVMKSMIFVGEE